MTQYNLNNLLEHGFEFLGFGLRLILSPTATNLESKVSVANIQVGLELLIKYRLAKVHGLQHICLTDISNLSNIAEKAARGEIKTKKYEWCKNSFVRSQSISRYERKLIDRFQSHRNAIVHFGVELPKDETIVACAHLILKVVRRIIEDEADTWMYNYLPDDVYKALIHFPPYVAEAIDDAHDNLKDVRLCFECGNETLTTLAGESHYCFCCGIQIYSEHAPYIDCPYCLRHMTVVYDSLNPDNGIYRGKCLACNESLLISKCASCEIEVFPEIFAKYDGITHWYCENCEGP